MSATGKATPKVAPRKSAPSSTLSPPAARKSASTTAGTRTPAALTIPSQAPVDTSADTPLDQLLDREIDVSNAGAMYLWMQDELTRVRREKDEWKKRAADCRKLLEDTEKDIHRRKEELKKFGRRLNGVESYLNKQQELLDNADIAEARTNMIRDNAQIVAELARLKNLHGKVMEQAKEEEDWEGVCMQQQQEIDNLRAQLETANDTIKELESQSRRRSAEHSTEVTGLKDEITRLHEEVIAKLQSDLEGGNNRMALLVPERDALANELKKVKDLQSEHTMAYLAAESRINNLLNNLTNY